ncbi:MAG TPA: hypothetical protein VF755_22295 [Catenuloplanes sp.]|jgi:hypothetical protein
MTRPGTAPSADLLARADTELLRLEAAAAAVAASLVDLDNNPARKDLDAGPLTGGTAAAWADASAALTQLWDGYALLTALVTKAREARGQRRFTDAEKAAYVEQVLGRSVTLSTTTVPLAQRSLLGAGQVTTTCSPAELLAAMEAAFRTAVAVAVRAGEIWSRMLPATADAAAAIDRARTQTRAAGGDLGTLEDADRRLHAFMSTLAADPFGCAEADLAAVRAAVARADAELTSAVELRSALTQRLTAAHSLAGELVTACAAATEAEAAATGRFPPAAITPGAHGPDLRADLAAIDALAAAGHWQLISARLAAWTDRARDRLAVVRTAAARNTALLATRSELRGRLEAYQAKAARRGWAEDATLSPLADAARTTLYTAPCELDAARAAVDAYQDAIAQLTATHARDNLQ